MVTKSAAYLQLWRTFFLDNRSETENRVKNEVSLYKKLSGRGSNAKKLAFFAAFDDSV